SPRADHSKWSSRGGCRKRCFGRGSPLWRDCGRPRCQCRPVDHRGHRLSAMDYCGSYSRRSQTGVATVQQGPSCNLFIFPLLRPKIALICVWKKISKGRESMLFMLAFLTMMSEQTAPPAQTSSASFYVATYIDVQVNSTNEGMTLLRQYREA